MRQMKDSGELWIGVMPSSWALVKGKYMFVQRNERGNNVQLQLLSPTQKYGCIPQSLYEELTGANTVKLNDDTDLNFLKTIHEGDFCISLRSFQGGFEYSAYDGVVSPAYQVFYPIVRLYKGFYKYLFKDDSFIAKMNTYTLSLRDGKNIAFSDFGNTFLPVPPLAEQERIAAYLDSVTAKIDHAIEEAKELIEAYKNFKRSVISEAVTKGLDKNAKMKDSDFQYWAQIPEHWDIKDIKYLFEIVKRIAGKEGYDILSVTQKGLKIKDISSNEGQIAEDYSNYQFVYPTDYVMNHMDLLTGWVDCSTVFGVTSPDYRVFRLREKEKHCLAYYKYVLQCCYMNKIFYSLGRGVSTQGRWRLQAPVFNNFKFPVPPLSEQEQIADYLDCKCAVIDKMIEKKEAIIEELQRYRKSVIYEYVTGKKQVAE